jgi:hypothetical protein
MNNILFNKIFRMGFNLALGSGYTALIQDVDGWGEGIWEYSTASYLSARFVLSSF